MDTDFKKQLKAVEKKIVKDVDVLIKPARRISLESDKDQILAFLDDATIFFKGHPKAQGITGKQLGYDFDILAFPNSKGISLYGNVKVSVPAGTPKTPHNEGDYSFHGRYKVNRATKCYVSGIKICFDEEKGISVTGIINLCFERDIAYVIQHLAEMNAGIFITAGKRTHIIDIAR